MSFSTPSEPNAHYYKFPCRCLYETLTKGKFKKESSDDDDLSDIDDEAMTLFVRKMGKFMKKKGYSEEREDITLRAKSM